MSKGGSEYGVAGAYVGGKSIFFNLGHADLADSFQLQRTLGHESLHSIGLHDEPKDANIKGYKLGIPEQRKVFKDLKGTPTALINPDHIMDLVY